VTNDFWLLYIFDDAEPVYGEKRSKISAERQFRKLQNWRRDNQLISMFLMHGSDEVIAQHDFED
jgi:hypothetical protein